MKAITALFICFLVPSVLAQLQFGFYDRSCPFAERTVANVVAKHYSRNKTVTAALLRMQFNDCFVNGCDASLLIDPTPGRPSEKSHPRNANVRGFEIIDEAKQRLEATCPGTVSCADIITLATRDSVSLAGGPRFQVRTGRRDGSRSNPDDVNLPGPKFSVDDSKKLFEAKGMNVKDMVTLIGGAHSVGVAHCSSFQDRLADPAMDRALNARLRNTCRASADTTVSLNQKTPFKIDNTIYGEIKCQRGILTIDQNLGLDKSTSETVSEFAASETYFKNQFSQSMVKMGSIQVLTRGSGEIRRNCRVFNKGVSGVSSI